MYFTGYEMRNRQYIAVNHDQSESKKRWSHRILPVFLATSFPFRYTSLIQVIIITQGT